MALCNVLVLVNVGIVEFSIYSEGGFHVTFQDRYFFCFIPSLSSNKKSPEALPERRGLHCEVFTMRGLKRYFNRRSTKAAVAGSSRGHISAARTDPNTPDPPDKQHFLSQALLALLWRFFFHTYKAKSFEARVSA